VGHFTERARLKRRRVAKTSVSSWGIRLTKGIATTFLCLQKSALLTRMCDGYSTLGMTTSFNVVRKEEASRIT